MPVKANALNRLIESLFRVEFDGLPNSLVQAFDPGERKLKISEHKAGGVNVTSKQGGDNEYTDAVLKMVQTVEGVDRSFWESWMDEVQNPRTGTGKLPTEYYRNFSVYQLHPDGNPAIAYEFYNAFPSQVKVGELNGNAGDKNVVEEVRITFEYREKRVI